jgi:hypothetical protein
LRRSWRPLLLRLDRLVADEAPDLLDLVHERLGAVNLGIGLVELGIDDGLDAAAPRRADIMGIPSAITKATRC